jgi:hypothetical protein
MSATDTHRSNKPHGMTMQFIMTVALYSTKRVEILGSYFKTIQADFKEEDLFCCSQPMLVINLPTGKKHH